MKRLSMHLPPIPKADNTVAFLKDAPQENSKLLYCQCLLQLTKMKLLGCPVGNLCAETDLLIKLN